MLAIDCLDQVISDIEKSDTLIIDTETRGLNPYKDGKILAGFGVLPLNGVPYYIPVRHFSNEHNCKYEDFQKVLAVIKGKNLVMHNCKFDLAVILQEGFDLSIENTIYDTLVLTRLVHEDLNSYKLKNLAQKFISPDAKDSESELKKYMRKNNCESYAHVPPSIMLNYAINDLIYTQGLFNLFIPVINKRNLEAVLNLEIALTKALFGMEQKGILLDIKYVKSQNDLITEELTRLEKEAYSLANREFRLTAAADISEVFGSLGISSKILTPTGRESWSHAALSSIQHPLATIILKYRSLAKLQSTYYLNFLSLCDENDVLHTNLNQSGAKTGRLSASNPNLQNIPKLSTTDKYKIDYSVFSSDRFSHEVSEEEASLNAEEAGKVRQAFIPRPGTFLLFADWAQVEPRIFADYSKEDGLLKAFELGVDTHALTAISAYGALPENRESDEYIKMRQEGKIFGLALLYGIGQAKLASQLHKSVDDAKRFKQAYFNRWKKANKFSETVREVIQTRGYIRNRFGRRRYLTPDLSYVALNFVIQSTAADMMKESIVNVYNAIKPYKSSLLLSIHDELVVEVVKEEAREVVPIVAETMKRCSRINIPFRVDMEWSALNWSDKVHHSLKCRACDGSGVIPSVPRDFLLDIIYRSSFKELESITAEQCYNCLGKGYDLALLEEA